ncbi:MAG: hypothetical protein QM805_07735 [Pseudomonas sp.]
MKLWNIILSIFAFIGKALRAYAQGREDGAAEARKEAAEKSERVRQEAKNVRNEIDGLSDDALKRRAGKWVRHSEGDEKADK